VNRFGHQGRAHFRGVIFRVKLHMVWLVQRIKEWWLRLKCALAANQERSWFVDFIGHASQFTSNLQRGELPYLLTDLKPDNMCNSSDSIRWRYIILVHMTTTHNSVVHVIK